MKLTALNVRKLHIMPDVLQQQQQQQNSNNNNNNNNNNNTKITPNTTRIITKVVRQCCM